MKKAPLKGLRYSFRERLNIQKVTTYAILINSVQILAAVVVVALSIFRQGNLIVGRAEIMTLAGMAVVVIWGAVLDIREAFAARYVYQETDMLEDANGQLESLNKTLRAQRHDFMNHLQVVYSLLELGEHQEAEDYIEKVYENIQRVGRTLKTGIAAVNALLAAKLSDLEEKGISVHLEIESSWENLPVSGWEMCRVLGNLIDNTIEALKDTEDAHVTIRLGENIQQYYFHIVNNGPVIEQGLMDRIFQSGFSTKNTGRGMGLAIVKRIMEMYHGEICVASETGRTCFSGVIQKSAPIADPTVTS